MLEHPEQEWNPLRSPGGTFTTFLYGAAVSLIFRRAVLDEAWSWVGLASVLFLFSDWVSRDLLPGRLPRQDNNLLARFDVSLAKAVLEIAGLFFLMALLLGVFPEGEKARVRPATTQAFAWFLVFNFVWNLLLLKIMQGLDWRHLLRVCSNGKGLESKEIVRYSKYLRAIADMLRPTEPSQDTLRAIEQVAYHARIPAINVSYRWLVQLFASHVALTGPLGALILFIRTPRMEVWDIWVRATLPGLLASFAAWAHLLYALTCVVGVLLLWSAARKLRGNGTMSAISRVPGLFCLLSIALYVATCWWPRFGGSAELGLICVLEILVPGLFFSVGDMLERYENWAGLCNRIGAVLLSALILGAYLLLPTESLIPYIALQQVVVTLFLCLVAEPTEANATEQPPAAELAAKLA